MRGIVQSAAVGGFRSIAIACRMGNRRRSVKSRVVAGTAARLADAQSPKAEGREAIDREANGNYLC